MEARAASMLDHAAPLVGLYISSGHVQHFTRKDLAPVWQTYHVQALHRY